MDSNQGCQNENLKIANSMLHYYCWEETFQCERIIFSLLYVRFSLFLPFLYPYFPGKKETKIREKEKEILWHWKSMPNISHDNSDLTHRIIFRNEAAATRATRYSSFLQFPI